MTPEIAAALERVEKTAFVLAEVKVTHALTFTNKKTTYRDVQGSSDAVNSWHQEFPAALADLKRLLGGE